MHEFTVRFRSVRDIQDFVALAGEYDFPIRVGTDRFQVNATSFMGIFALNCRKPLRVCVRCTEEEFSNLCQTLSPYLET